jgi:surfactin synthase thioesterase subunit
VEGGRKETVVDGEHFFLIERTNEKVDGIGDPVEQGRKDLNEKRR